MDRSEWEITLEELTCMVMNNKMFYFVVTLVRCIGFA
jgi:hypothetical protein